MPKLFSSCLPSFSWNWSWNRTHAQVEPIVTTVSESTTTPMDAYKRVITKKVQYSQLSALFAIELKKDLRYVNISDKDLQILLEQVLSERSKALGFQACLQASDNDVSDDDWKKDIVVQKILQDIQAKADAYVVEHAGALKSHLIQIPSAFISAGVNPNDPKSKDKDPQVEHQKLKADLNAAGITAIEVDGYYDGAENSFMVVLNQQLKTKTFREFINSPDAQKLIELARKYNQDSVLLQWGAAQFYYYPSQVSKDQDKIRYGEGWNIYLASASDKPDNYYSKVHQVSGEDLIFQLTIDFDHDFTLDEFEMLCEYKTNTRFNDFYMPARNIIAEFKAVDPSETLDTFTAKAKPFDDKITSNANASAHHDRHLILMRGTDGYIEWAKKLREELIKNGASPEEVCIFGSDAYIKAINEAGITNFTQVKPLMVGCNRQAGAELLKNPKIKYMIFADMCKRIHEYPTWLGEVAQQQNVKVTAWNIYDAPEQCVRPYQVRHKDEIQKTTETDTHIYTTNTNMAIPQIRGTGNMSEVISTCMPAAAINVTPSASKSLILN